jgi:galactose mutarotase-like enzyme
VLELRAGDATATIDPSGGGRVDSLRVGDIDLLLTPHDDHEGKGHFGAFVMAPWAGRTRHGIFHFDGVEHHVPVESGAHAIHGTVRNRPWAVESADVRRAKLSCDLGPHWPFAGWVEHVLTLHDDRFELELSVHTADASMPAVCGWHPWWRRSLPDGQDATLDLHAGAMYRKDSDGIAVPELLRPPPAGPWDDCFTELASSPALQWGETVRVVIETDCPAVVVYDQRDDAVCVEPQTAPPDALNHDPFVVERDHPLRAATTWRWR